MPVEWRAEASLPPAATNHRGESGVTSRGRSEQAVRLKPLGPARDGPAGRCSGGRRAGNVQPRLQGYSM